MKGIEDGQEPKEKGSFALPEIFGGTAQGAGANVKGGGKDAKAPAKAPAPAAKGAGPQKGA